MTHNKETDKASAADHYWMDKALELASQAAKLGEVPVGAILLAPETSSEALMDSKRVLAKAFNEKERLKTPLGHAEILCLHRASRKLQAWRLLNSTLYVTLEPCLMCAGAILQARVKRLVFATPDPKAGASGSLFSVLQDARLNHRCEITSNIRAQESANLLKAFFRERRKRP